MYDKPTRRRWFQFRLSTWFVLVAILAWAMACRPWIVSEEYAVDVSRSDFLAAKDPLGYQHDRTIGGGIETLDDGSVRYHYRYEHYRPNASLAWPAAALTASLAWKAAWAVGPRRVRRFRPAAPE